MEVSDDWVQTVVLSESLATCLSVLCSLLTLIKSAAGVGGW